MTHARRDSRRDPDRPAPLRSSLGDGRTAEQRLASSPVCLFAVLLAVVFALPALAAGDDWPQFRGPGGLGEAEAIDLPLPWAEGDFVWRVALPGKGHSSPVVRGGRVYLTSGNEETGELIVLAYNAADGKPLWRRVFACDTYKMHQFNAYSAATPVVDEKRLYLNAAAREAYFVVALNVDDGAIAWRRDFAPFVAQHGAGASVALCGELVIVPNDQDGPSFCAALNRATGEIVWKVDRKSVRAAYGTPLVFQPAGASPQIILSSMAHGLTSLNPADGRVNWEISLFTYRTVGSPTAAGGTILAGCGEGGSGKRFVAVTPADAAKGIEPKVVHDFEGALPYVPIPVARGDLAFLWTDAGVVSCYQTGSWKMLWRERVGGKYFASPIRVGDKVFCPSRDGEMVVLAAAPEYRLITRFPLPEGTHATPAVADGMMFVRTYGQLFAVGKPRPE